MILKDDPPGPIIIPALIAVKGVSLDPKTCSTSYLDLRCFDKRLSSFGSIPQINNLFHLANTRCFEKLSANKRSVSSKLA